MSDDKAYQREPIGSCEHCGEWPTHDRDWAAFWRSLPPREQWEAAKAMPKVAGPWDRDGRRYAAHDAPPTCPVASGHHTAHDRASADAALREADWVLVDEGPK